MIAADILLTTSVNGSCALMIRSSSSGARPAPCVRGVSAIGVCRTADREFENDVYVLETPCQHSKQHKTIESLRAKRCGKSLSYRIQKPSLKWRSRLTSTITYHQ